MTTLAVLFLWSFAAATVLPLSSEVPLALAINQTGGWRAAVMVATLGNYLGACTTFVLARAAAARFQVDARPRARHAAGCHPAHVTGAPAPSARIPSSVAANSLRIGRL